MRLFTVLRRAAVLAAFLSITTQSATAQETKQILPYTVVLSQPIAKPVAIQDGLLSGRCEGTRCTVTAPSGTTANQICEALRSRFGVIERVAQGQRSLTAGEIKTCNEAAAGPPLAGPSQDQPSAVAPPVAALPAVTPKSEAAVDGGGAATEGDGGGAAQVDGGMLTPAPPPSGGLKEAPSDLKEAPPAIREAPRAADLDGGESLTRLPREGAPPGPSDAEGFADEAARRRGAQDAAAAVREEMARRSAAPEITGFGLSGECLPFAQSTLTIEGRRFGPSAGSRRVMVGSRAEFGRPFDARWEAPIVAWRDEGITVEVRSVPAGTWGVAIVDGAGEVLSNVDRFRRCPESFPISGRIDLGDCNAPPRRVALSLQRQSPPEWTTPVALRPHPSSDLWFHFEHPIRPGRYELSARLTGDACSGGSWSPPSYSIVVSEYDGSPGAPRSDYDFTFRNVELTTTRIPAIILTGVIQSAFDGLEIRLNNWAGGEGDGRGSWLLADDAWIELPDALGGRRVPLNLPAGRGGVYRYYIRDVNLDRVSVSRDGDAVAIRLVFESSGRELMGYCWGTDAAIDLDCPVGPDDSAPDVEVDDLAVRILLPPARFVPDRGPAGISYGAPRVVATARVQAGGICAAVDVCALLVDYERMILDGIEIGLQGTLDQRWLRQIVADGVNAAIAASPFGPIGDVNSVAFDGADLVIRHRPR